MRILLFALGALFLSACQAPDDDNSPQWETIDMHTEPVALGAPRVGQLIYRGGVVLHSTNSQFGGISDITMLDNERFLSMSDNGDWFAGRLILDDQGQLTGVADVRYAMMRDETGVILPNKAVADSEGLTQLPDGRVAVSFERTQVIRIYDINRDGPFGAATSGPRPRGAQDLPSNSGMEALASTADGDIIASSEGEEDRRSLIWRAPVGARDPVPVLTHYRLGRGYSLTGMDRLPDGSFVALERFFTPVIGPRARITRFPAASLDAASDTLPNVEELATIAAPLTVDNFEGITAVQMPNGATRLYIVSDDNFSARQRTLLLAFDIAGSERAN